MSSNDIEELTDKIREFSVIDRASSELSTGGPADKDFKDILLSMASIFRQKELGYNLRYTRPDKPEFRLRSDKELNENSDKLTLEFSEPGRSLELEIDSPGTDVFRGILEELRILGNLDSTEKDETVREPELNLLVSRTYQAELYSEYQRWKRYETPFLVSLAYLKNDEQDWKPAGRAHKHVGKTRDIIGYLGQNRVSGFFPSVYDTDPIRNKLSDQLSAKYDDDEIDLSFFEVPNDFNNWNSMKKRIFSPIYLNEF